MTLDIKKKTSKNESQFTPRLKIEKIRIIKEDWVGTATKKGGDKERDVPEIKLKTNKHLFLGIKSSIISAAMIDPVRGDLRLSI